MSKFHGSIDDIIKDSEKVSLSDTDILNITDHKCTILTYQDLERFNTIDEVLGTFGAVVILYQHDQNFGHWVALFRVNDTILDFFDPFGIKLDTELKFSPFNLRLHQGKEVKHLSHLIDQSRYKLIQNTTKFQEEVSDVNTCGRWCALRVRFREISLKRFSKIFAKTDCYTPDWIVSALTLLFS